jgi:hypothetical protein
MECLKCRVENFPMGDYLTAVLKNMKSMCIKAKDWCSILLSRMLNDSEYLLYLKKSIHLADKETLLNLLDYMENDEPLERHKPIIAELRSLVNT